MPSRARNATRRIHKTCNETPAGPLARTGNSRAGSWQKHAGALNDISTKRFVACSKACAAGLCNAARADECDLRCGERFLAVPEVQAAQLLKSTDAQEVTLGDAIFLIDMVIAVAEVKVCQP